MDNLIAFAFVAGLLTVVPGLDTALVLRTAALEGTGRALMTALGIACGCLGWAIAVSIGLGALFAASQLAYDALRIVGGAYIIWLGGRMLWSAIGRDGTGLPAAYSIAGDGAHNSLARGFLTNILNPKVGAFYVSLLPHFIPPHANVVAFGIVLGLIHAVEGFAWFWLLTSVMKKFAGWIARGQAARWFDGIAGTVLVLFGGALLFEHR